MSATTEERAVQIPLRPCPFCGHRGRITARHSRMIECSNDRCYASPRVVCETIEEAVRAWNKRHYDAWSKRGEDGR